MAKYTLIDVMRGIRKHGLIDKMSPECFAFLIGLILEANEIGFKNPIGFTVNQALPIGGGNSRQTLNNRRRSLSKVKIDGDPIVTIVAGNNAQNSVATYDIDYNLLCSLNDSWSDHSSQPSNKIDSTYDSYETALTTGSNRVTHGPLDGSRTILRSEEKRKEKKNTPAENIISDAEEQVAEMPKEGVVLSQKDEERKKTRDRSKEVEYVQDMILDAFTPQLTQKPSYPACRSALDTYGFDVLEAAAIEARGKALKNPTPHAALNYVIGIARNGQSGLTYDQRSKIAGTLKELKLDLLAAEKEPEDSDKFNDVFVAGGIVNGKQEFCEAVKGEIDRLKQMMGG